MVASIVVRFKLRVKPRSAVHPMKLASWIHRQGAKPYALVWPVVASPTCMLIKVGPSTNRASC